MCENNYKNLSEIQIDVINNEVKFPISDNELNELKKLPISQKDAISLNEQFYFTNKPCKNGHLAKRRTSNTACYPCSIISARKYYDNRSEEQIKQKSLSNKNWVKNNKEKRRQWKLNYYINNKEKCKEWDKKSKKKSFKNPFVRFNRRISAAIRSYINKNLDKCKAKNGSHWEDLLDYTFIELIEYLEKMFDSNMSWDNHGSYWHIDHIVPLSFCDCDIKEAWCLYNLQPLAIKDNLEKNNTYIGHPNNPIYMNKETYKLLKTIKITFSYNIIDNSIKQTYEDYYSNFICF